ncbi:YbaB/EbfC family nucleoid-associated protein [Micromonospora purpureochromogenes]|uniref:DNA-binding protein YbaB n=1 Tax=Micromonospora purpureochromogenes TaxID=47872 RepID=A0ABX2RD86_9ACTN|nr:YbaB/EbfC family nucleoid-associated protein [Micromonospora purpureochromogenes]NYF54457.1 DNA-binding protein YbaB [Micromonospora purpureochromogenes]
MTRPDLGAMMRQMTEAMTSTVDFAEQAATRRHTVSSPDGEVTVEMSGNRELLSIRIDPRAKRTTDNLTLGELVTETIRAANREAERAQQDLMDSLRIGEYTVGDVLRDPARLMPRLPDGGDRR